MTQIDGEPKIALGAITEAIGRRNQKKNEGEGGLESLLTPK
jgi:hypothetical protein